MLWRLKVRDPDKFFFKHLISDLSIRCGSRPDPAPHQSDVDPDPATLKDVDPDPQHSLFQTRAF
jgi:hypothetical protein